jgi:hypothetical protein
VLFQVISIVIGANASFRDWTLYDPLDVKRKAHSAYYFEKWPAVHKAFNDNAAK